MSMAASSVTICSAGPRTRRFIGAVDLDEGLAEPASVVRAALGGHQPGGTAGVEVSAARRRWVPPPVADHGKVSA